MAAAVVMVECIFTRDRSFFVPDEVGDCWFVKVFVACRRRNLELLEALRDADPG